MKNIFKGFLLKIKQLEKDNYLDNLSASKIKKLNSLLLNYISRYNDKFLNENNSKITKELREVYSLYSLKGFMKNNKGIKGYKIFKLKKRFRKKLRERILNSLLLIKTQNNETMQKLNNRFLNWIQKRDKPIQKELDLNNTINTKDKHVKMILKDQTRKMIGNFDNIVAEEYKALGFYWKTRRDNRVVGNPAGKYPLGNEKHNDHFHRQDKFYFYHNTWALEKKLINTKNKDFKYADFQDGMPGQSINCRCYAYNIYELNDVPTEFLNEKGKKYLKNN